MEAQEHIETEAYISVITYWGFGHDPLCFFLHLWRDEGCWQAPNTSCILIEEIVCISFEGRSAQKLIEAQSGPEPKS